MGGIYFCKICPVDKILSKSPDIASTRLRCFPPENCVGQSPFPMIPKSSFSSSNRVSKFCVFSFLSWAGVTQAGSLTHDYSATPADGTILNSTNLAATVVSGGRLRLTQNGVGSTYAAMRLPDLDAGKEITEFTVQFDLTLFCTATPADGLALSFGNISATPADLINPAINTGEKGFVTTNGLAVDIDTYGDGPLIEAKAAGTVIKSVYMGNAAAPGGNWGAPPVTNTYPFDNVSRRVIIHWEVNTGLDVRITGSNGSQVDVMVDTALPGFVPTVGNVFAFGARTGGSTEDVFLDNLSIVTVPVVPIETGGPSISEFVADNETQEDEDCTTGAWLEIYNGQNVAQTMTGWSLTDDAGVLGKWPFPAGYSIPAYGYVRIWADGKNRTASSANYHTNFILNKAGGYLALVKPDLSIATAYTYGAQSKDVSYGKLGAAQTDGYLETPTPGVKNSGLQAPLGPCKQDVIFSHVGGLITGPMTLTLTAPTVAGAVARYTTDNSVPNASSTLWPAGGLNVTGSSNIRVRYYQPDALGGDVSSRTFILLDSTLTNYRGSGQPFSSNLPIIVMNSFGINIDGAGGASGLRPFRNTYTVALAPDPANSNKTSLTGPVDMQNRGGTHVRGETSAGFAQKPYGLEIWDNKEQDKAVNLLGWPAESDYVLISNYNDKSVIRNMMPFDMKRNLSGDGSAMKEKYVEVFFKQDGSGPLTYADYKGIYVLTEKIKRDKDRVNIEELKPCDGVFTNNPAVDDAGIISGGYIIRKDKASPEAAFTTTGGTTASPAVTYPAQTLQIVEPNNPSVAQQNYIKGFVNRMEAALYGASFADPVNGYAKYLDTQSWIDGHLWVEIFKQADGYRLSTYMYKDRNGKLKYAPLWDYNLSSGNASPAGGYNNGQENPSGWYYSVLGLGDYPYHPRLFQDPAFLRAYWDRYWQLRRTIFTNANVLATIDGYISQLKNGTPGIPVGGTLVTNGTGTWPASTPSLDVPIGRHNARWQRMGIYDWPNASNPTLRTSWETNWDPATFTSASNPFSAVSETAFVRIWMLSRLQWMDDQSMSYAPSVKNFKPPTMTQYGGEVPSGFVLGISDPNAVPGSIYYTTDGSDPAAGGGTLLASGSVTLMGETAAVSYLVPSTTNGGSTLVRTQGDPNQWNGLADPPNIANWSTGTFGLGYDYNDATPPLGTDVLYAPFIGTNVQSLMLPNTIVPLPSPLPPNNATIFTRSSFNVDAAQLPTLLSLKLNVRYDDAYICYLNGVEVARKNYAGTNPTTTQASGTTHADAASIVFEEVDISGFKSYLVAGTNVLCFHGLNATSSSANTHGKDFLLQPKLTATVASLPITQTTFIRARIKDASNNWSPLTEGNFIVNAVPASVANVVISEMNYNPTPPTPAETTASGANNANDFEFIEIMNISNQTVDLTGCAFTLGITFNWASAPANKQTLGPGQRMILVENLAAFSGRYSSGSPNIAGAYVGNLANGGETITFNAANGSVIKSFTYDDVEPWPVDSDLNLNASNQVVRGGYSLVLNNPLSNPVHSNGANWRSSAVLGGKPGQDDSTAAPAIPNGDSDGDGIPDIVEYAVGSQLGNGAQSKLPQLGWADFNTGAAIEPCLSLTFTRNLNADNVTVTPKVSSDLDTWDTGTVALTYVDTHNNGDGTATVIYRSTQPASALPTRMFAKLEVTAP